MNFDAGNTSDPVGAQARGSDTVEDREDNDEVTANDKSEEAVLTVISQIQSPTTDRDNDDLQGATAAIVRSHLHDEDKHAANIPWLESEVTSLNVEMPPVRPLGATAAEESASAPAGTIALGRPLGATAAEESLAVLEQRITEACAGFQQVLLDLEQLRRRVYQREQWIREERNRKRRERRESEMQEGARQLTVPACPLQQLKYRKKGPSQHCEICNICIDQHAQDNHHCLPDECCICWELLDPVFAECCTLPCLHKIHKKCKDQLVQHGISNCPLCRGPLSPPRQ